MSDCDLLGRTSKLVDIMQDNSHIEGMIEYLKLGDKGISIAVIRVAPLLFRLCRAASGDAAEITDLPSPPIALWEKSAVVIVGASDRVKVLIAEADMAKVVGVAMNVVEASHVKWRANICAWLAATRAKVEQAINDLVKASAAEDVTSALAIAHGSPSSEDMNTALDADGIEALHDSMKVLRAMDKSLNLPKLRAFADANADLLKDADVQTFCMQMFTRLSADNKALCKAGSTLADLIMAQALHRDLDPGEYRKDIVRRISAGLAKRRWHEVSPILHEAIAGVMGTT